MKNSLFARGLLSSLLISFSACASEGGGGAASRVSATSSAADFDFLVGQWTIENRKLLRPLSGSNEWETFHADQFMRKLPGNIGNYDDFIAESWRPGFVGMSLRIFNPETRMWSIYWLNNRVGGLDPATGQLTPPVVGKFVGDVGIFEANDTINGKPTRVRYTWSEVHSAHPRWEQAFSVDNGQTWETNWIMVMTRKS